MAASRALQQNAKLKLEVDELQKELVNLINGKAEVISLVELTAVRRTQPTTKKAKIASTTHVQMLQCIW